MVRIFAATLILFSGCNATLALETPAPTPDRFKKQLYEQLRGDMRNAKHAQEFVPSSVQADQQGIAPEQATHSLNRHAEAPSDERCKEMDVRVTPKELHQRISKQVDPEAYARGVVWTTDVACDPCPFPPPAPYFDGYNMVTPDGLTGEWHWKSYVNPPFTGMAKWARKALTEFRKGKEIVFLCPATVRQATFNPHSGVEEMRSWYRDLLEAGGVELELTPGAASPEERTHGYFCFKNPNAIENGGTSPCEATTFVDVVAVHLKPRAQSPPLCKFWSDGTCMRGDNCRFAHEPRQSFGEFAPNTATYTAPKSSELRPEAFEFVPMYGGNSPFAFGA